MATVKRRDAYTLGELLGLLRKMSGSWHPDDRIGKDARITAWYGPRKLAQRLDARSLRIEVEYEGPDPDDPEYGR